MMAPGTHKATAGGILMPSYTKYLCKWCGAAFEKDDGCEHHEMQCAEPVRIRLICAALQNPAMAGMEASTVVTHIERVMAVVHALPRKSWDEIRI
jgi:hypothetical protein